jgi:glucose/arabinose dehydrogenase
MQQHWKKALILVLLVAGIVASVTWCQSARKSAINAFTPEYKAEEGALEAVIDGNDVGRPRLPAKLTVLFEKLIQPTDLQFVPGDPQLLLVLEKAGPLKWVDLATKQTGTVMTLKVLDESEQGLLGLAFHPKYQENGRLFLFTTVKVGGDDVDRVAEWRIPPGSDWRKTAPTEHHVLLDVKDPYQNHNAGQLTFGPDGFLYVGQGDGGWKDDPHGNGQNTAALLGKMLRLDVDGKEPYAVPPSNPFVGKAGFAPEIFAYGLRNPWRYSFDPAGRLIVGDVGQDDFEEVDLVPAGANLGWKIREAMHCFDPKEGCKSEGLLDPIWEYGRDDGGSITGGYVSTSDHFPALKGKYVVGDFLSGRIWAIDLPDEPGQKAKQVYALGRWPILISTFGRDAEGKVYVADYPRGRILRIDP